MKTEIEELKNGVEEALQAVMNKMAGLGKMNTEIGKYKKGFGESLQALKNLKVPNKNQLKCIGTVTITLCLCQTLQNVKYCKMSNIAKCQIFCLVAIYII